MRYFVSTVELTPHGPVLRLPPHGTSQDPIAPVEGTFAVSQSVTQAAHPVVVCHVLTGDRELAGVQRREPFGLLVTPEVAHDAEFATWIHDINNQLLVLTGHLETLNVEREVGSRSESIEAIRGAHARLVELTRSRQAAPHAIAELNQLVRETAATLGPVFSNQVQLELASSPIGIGVNADGARLLILNLISSLLGLITDGQVLRVTTSREKTVPPAALLRVVLPPEEPRGDPLADLSEGGPDLAAATAIARRLGLSMDIDCTAHGELSVQIQFPIAVEQISGQSPGPRRVLLIEDQADVRRFIAQILESHDFEVVQARHGAEALALIARRDDALDLLITDLSLPEMSGRAIAAVLRSERPQLPVLYMSGTADASSAHNEPHSEFLAKPFRVPDLLTAVTRLLNSIPS